MNIIPVIYPDILIHSQVSGRHSTVNPPLAQIPQALHNIFEPDAGEWWIGGDFSGQEVWIISAESNDLPTLNALREGYDSHTMALCEGMDWQYPYDLKTPRNDEHWLEQYNLKDNFKKWRKWFKVCRLAMNYGKRPENLYMVPGSLQFGINQEKGAIIAERYLEKHPALTLYWAQLEEHIKEKGYVRSFAGRKRNLYSKGDARRREGFNGPMQQGGADILNMTICRVCDTFQQAHYVYGVHDSFWFAFPKPYSFHLQKVIETVIMQPFIINRHELTIPIEWKYRI